jgi:hypothetical protein
MLFFCLLFLNINSIEEPGSEVEWGEREGKECVWGEKWPKQCIHM